MGDNFRVYGQSEMTKESKDDILSALPEELLAGEKVSQADLIKFAPVLAHQQALAYEKKAINETQAQHDAAAAARSKEGSIWEFMKRNPVAMVGALGAGYCLAKGLAEFGGNTNFASYKRQHKWMKGRLFSQAFCLVACVGGHQYHIYQYEKREAEKKRALYRRTRLHLPANRHLARRIRKDAPQRGARAANGGDGRDGRSATNQRRRLFHRRTKGRNRRRTQSSQRMNFSQIRRIRKTFGFRF